MGLSKKNILLQYFNFVGINCICCSVFFVYASLSVCGIYESGKPGFHSKSSGGVCKGQKLPGPSGKKNPTGSASVEIPYVGNKIYLAGKAFRIAVELNDKELLEMVCQLRDAARSAESFADIEMPDMDIEKVYRAATAGGYRSVRRAFVRSH